MSLIGFKFTRIWHLLTLCLFVLISFTACFNNPEQFEVGLGEVFTIGVGGSAIITGEDMTVTFKGVIGDSRCAQNVTCIWEGVASSNINIAYQSKDYILVLNSPGLSQQNTENFIDYTITYSLNPYPIEGEEISPEDYLLTLTLTKPVKR